MTDDGRLYNTIAPLKNVAALVGLVDRVKNRQHGLPGMACYCGYSGFGKSTAATYAGNKFQAIVIEADATWSGGKLCRAILGEMGTKPAVAISDMVEQIAKELAITQTPLIVDEADHILKRGIIEILRAVHQRSDAPVILIGEEQLPQHLRQYERVHGRMLDWQYAQPGDMDDVALLAPIYAHGITLSDELKEVLLRSSNASLRRICVNLSRVAEFAMTRGIKSVGRDDWGKREFFTGEPPKPRRGMVA